MAKPILIKPIITEKMTRLTEEGRHYAFQVTKDANKLEIRQAVEERYPGVDIKEMRTMIVRCKRTRQMTRRGAVEGFDNTNSRGDNIGGCGPWPSRLPVPGRGGRGAGDGGRR